jgi:hypothetical protein
MPNSVSPSLGGFAIFGSLAVLPGGTGISSGVLRQVGIHDFASPGFPGFALSRSRFIIAHEGFHFNPTRVLRMRITNCRQQAQPTNHVKGAGR